MKKSCLLFCLLLGLIFIPEPASTAHNEIGRTRCLDCHVTIPLNPKKLSYHEDIATVCRQCHTDDHAKTLLSHPVDIIPTITIPSDMPLDRKGKLTCITCHTFHAEWNFPEPANPYALRRPQGKTFCYYCHKKL